MSRRRPPGPKTMGYPDALNCRVGCKVSWLLYATREEAEKAGVAANHNAEIDERNGYDFGFCVPGAITQVEGGFEVCIP